MKQEIREAIKSFSDELEEELRLRQMIDDWCCYQLGNTKEAMDKADRMFSAARDIFYKNSKPPTG